MFYLYQIIILNPAGAKLTGRSVGIAATANIQHATPAVSTLHLHDRKDHNEIAK
ncbi:MAG: alkaline phosphatase [Syntrophorhabdaceae bacterium]|jgi:alkaline phosphatase|nr:alkaline phosphatase [Syntrophorhabdaceae bacterium]MBP8697691.1 alkaline phosphatase [Syntrophorhabdaceae bacterium]